MDPWSTSVLKHAFTKAVSCNRYLSLLFFSSSSFFFSPLPKVNVSQRILGQELLSHHSPRLVELIRAPRTPRGVNELIFARGVAGLMIVAGCVITSITHLLLCHFFSFSPVRCYVTLTTLFFFSRKEAVRRPIFPRLSVWPIEQDMRSFVGFDERSRSDQMPLEVQKV